jgi:hypothetical protein
MALDYAPMDKILRNCCAASYTRTTSEWGFSSTWARVGMSTGSSTPGAASARAGEASDTACARVKKKKKKKNKMHVRACGSEGENGWLARGA